MTQCSDPTLPFPPSATADVEADFSGGSLTTDAGALLLREADRRLGLLDALDRCHPRPARPRPHHPPPAPLCSPSASSASPAATRTSTTTSTSATTRSGKSLAEYDPDPEQPLASAPTLCRLENRVSRPALFDMARCPGRAVHRLPRPSRPSAWSSTSTPPTTPSTATRRAASSTATTTTTASCRCTSSAATDCWSPTCGTAEHRRRAAHPGHPQAAGRAACARPGPACASSSAATAASAAGG